MNEELINLLRQVKDQWGRETVAAIIKRLDTYPIKWKGTLRRSITYEQQEGADGDIDFFMADYGKFVDDGVNGTSTSRGSQFSFKGNWKGTAFYIKPWATSKGISPFAVAKSIQKKGIKPRPFFNSVIEQRVAVLGEDITQAVADYMEQQVTNFNNKQS